MPHLFHIDCSHRSAAMFVHIDHTSNSHRSHNDFTSISRYHIDHTMIFTTISHLYRVERGEFVHPVTTRHHPAPAEQLPGTGRAPAAPRHTTKWEIRAPAGHRPSTGRATARHKLSYLPLATGGNRRTLAPTQLRLARPHARHERHARHKPKSKSISRLFSPPNLQCSNVPRSEYR